jgi:hypothetical protein
MSVSGTRFFYAHSNRVLPKIGKESPMELMHNRDMVIKLQKAHANHIESIYRQSLCLPGNPDGIEIVKVGETPVFLSNQNRLENRAIFTGNETLAELEEVTACFERKGVDGFFEINPANFYRTNPFSWKSEMVPALIELGYHPGDLRCVWFLDEDPGSSEIEATIPLKLFTSNQADAYIEDKLVVEPLESTQIEHEKKMIKHHFTESWIHFIGYDRDRPVSISKLFIFENIGYLAWGYTAKGFRRMGHHRRHVLARVRHAFEMGCNLVFTVTDFNVPSSLSLQKVGFKLAYNYLLMEKHAAK